MTDIRQKIEDTLANFTEKRGESASDFAGREAALLDIFSQCGFQMSREFPITHGNRRLEVDGAFSFQNGGRTQRIAIEIKHSVRPEAIFRAIEHVHAIRRAGRYDRALVVATGEIPEAVRRRAEGDAIGYIDLLGIPELRSWLWKHAPALQNPDSPHEPTCAQIIREAMRAIAERLARAPEEISTIDWRDMERVLREVFEGMGFDTTLTRCGKDGGFDLELLTQNDQGSEIFLVEVKHWSAQKPGKANLRKLVRVTAKQRANRGILLSSSGFSPSIYEGFTEAERSTVALGGRDKIIALCTTYYRIGQQIWHPGTTISTQLLDGLQ